MNCRHRDYLDAGALLYKCLPVLGRAMAWLKRRLG
ncbi:transcriptional regulator [Pseudomonas laurylsulfatiphila]|uniref:Transcriptional regulator n=1 Tax=Pseudomonas laurylsulfatiphila TaxID=2011015 RepID=A0A2S6FND0_9PSED|nr:transcriptional regulator [Pseudomonas laurylsulfatiphila]